MLDSKSAHLPESLMKITHQIACAWKKVIVRRWCSCKIGEDSMAQGSDVASDLNPDPRYRSKLENGMYSMQWTDFTRPEVAGLLKFVWEGTTSCLPEKMVLDKELPVRKPYFKDLHSEKFKSGVWVAWLGHACVLVQIEGVRILTDPVFSKKCGPTMMVSIGPARYRDAPCDVADLPRIDVVVISHNHYDHLDVQTVRDLNKRWPKITWLVPMGVAEWMKSTGCRNVFELNWWQKQTVSNLSFYFVPAQHWSKRGATDTNKTLWGGWCVLGKSRKFYFTGDTGYHDGLFKEIGRLLGPFDLAAIPIGAYEPRWFMKFQHINPEDALEIHRDVQAKKSIGIHWATFNLSSESILEPRKTIRELQQLNDDKEGDFFTVNPGETRFLDD